MVPRVRLLSVITKENHVTSKQQQSRILLKKNPSIQIRLSLIFPLILVRFAWDLKQIHRKNNSNMPKVCDIRTNIWLKVIDVQQKNSVARQLLLTRSLKVSKYGHCGVSASNPMAI